MGVANHLLIGMILQAVHGVYVGDPKVDTAPFYFFPFFMTGQRTPPGNVRWPLWSGFIYHWCPTPRKYLVSKKHTLNNSSGELLDVWGLFPEGFGTLREGWLAMTYHSHKNHLQEIPETLKFAWIITHMIHVWHIYLHLVDFYGKCRWIYHTWILWVMGFLRGSTGRYHQIVHFSRPQRHPAMPRPDDCRSLLQPLQLPAETKQHIFRRVGFMNGRKSMGNLMVVEPTPSKHISQNGNLPQIGLKIKDIRNHHLDGYSDWGEITLPTWQFFVNFLGWLMVKWSTLKVKWPPTTRG